jgi:hypothetical protein
MFFKIFINDGSDLEIWDSRSGVSSNTEIILQIQTLSTYPGFDCMILVFQKRKSYTRCCNTGTVCNREQWIYFFQDSLSVNC